MFDMDNTDHENGDGRCPLHDIFDNGYMTISRLLSSLWSDIHDQVASLSYYIVSSSDVYCWKPLKSIDSRESVFRLYHLIFARK